MPVSPKNVMSLKGEWVLDLLGDNGLFQGLLQNVIDFKANDLYFNHVKKVDLKKEKKTNLYNTKCGTNKGKNALQSGWILDPLAAWLVLIWESV